MISLKKLYGDELLRLALVLSLLKVDPNDYLERETQQMIAGLHISNGSDWSLDQEARTFIRPRFVHPKSLDNILINYERQLFEELNSLGRYGNPDLEYNERIWNNRAPILHTYLVNNVATDTVAPQLATATVPENADQDSVSADDNVAQEIKVSDEEEETTNNEERPDAVVTLSADFLHNRTEEDIFAEIASRSFDVNELLVQPSEMQIKKENEDFEVRVKKEEEDDDLYSDNAIDFMPYFNSKTEMDLGETNSVFQQNLADLQEFGEVDEAKELKHDLEYLDVKQQQENLEQYLMENTPLDSEVYELAPMFEEELVLNVKRERASTSFTASSSGVSDMDGSSDGVDVKIEPDEGHHTGDELTQEDMDLIEVLWKQDVDMGFSLEDPMQPEGPMATKVLGDEIEKELKLAEEKIVKNNEEKAEIEKVKAKLLDSEIKEDDPWAGLSYTVDTETGEYVIQGDLPRELVSSEESRFDLLEEALGLVELGDEAETKNEPPEAIEGSSSGSSSSSEMLHPAMRHVPHHHLAHYHNQSLMRSMSVEQRWQDLASLLTIPPPPPPDQYQHYHHHHHHQHPHPHPHNISAHGAAGGYGPNYHAPIPPVPEKHPEAYAGGAAAPLDGAYKVESAQHPQQHDPLYYQNASAEMPGPTNQDGFLQSILNDEDLQLMDMAMNEGMYTMRMLDGASAHHAPHHNHSHMMITERDSASDSAVSSMGSERVPSLSDGEWCDGSDSAQEFHSSKFRPYDNSFGRERAAPHQAQKKHHMFGKRCFQEQPAPALDPVGRPGVVKYECPEQTYHHDNMHMHNVDFAPRPQLPPPHVTNIHGPALDLNTAHSSHALLQSNIPSPAPPRFTYATPERVRHNHTYSAPLAAAEQRPAAVRDKRVRRLTDGSMSDGGSSATSSGQHLSRDEKRAKALGIPLEVQDIINLPMDEFNERLSKHDLSEAQLSLIRDIRRRGKNKACIIGKETKKCLFLGVRNKYCYTCQYYERRNMDIKAHNCCKNFTGPSTAMESDIIVEGFQKSEEMHQLRYLKFIGDGDSSVFSKLKEKVSYGNIIKKIECKNHVIKNYTSALYKVAAQNCRKRKLDQITSLADEVRTVRDRKIRTQRDHSSLIAERQRVKERFAALYRHVFQNLRDPEGRPLSSQQYSLQQAADGNVVLVPKMPQHQDHPMNRTNDDDMDRKAKSYDQ